MSIYNILKEIRPSLKKNLLEKEIDLIDAGILDSFEMLEFIQLLEAKHKFDYENYVNKYSDFKIKNLEEYLEINLF